MRKVLRVDLVSHAMTDALRGARFPTDEPLTEAGRRAAAARDRLRADRVRTAPERRAVETAALLDLAGEQDARLRDLDAGAWRGAELTSVPPDELHAWLTDPEFRGHGGEAVVDVVERARQWLTAVAHEDTPTVAVTHPAVIRAALLVVLDAPPKSFWRMDIPPLSVTRLHYRGEWTLRFAA
ncbi:histidine phosphatase family protein [Nocardia wallacei]|uniref:Phosphoglycerate mutase n=1 Tax=Nocardia wallacei TaxID=480035 RepID=A0A7G1KST8_9NOCA|nr:histidine phosphatase family protein [Nocardia wallacei]BCK58295.1 phosphoglycerate mutase [Nocardia wallacei]